MITQRTLIRSLSLCLIVIGLLWSAGLAFSQPLSVPVPASLPAPVPVNLVGLRAGYDGYATPSTSGGLWYAHLITGASHPTYSYTSMNFQPLLTKPYITMTTTETGIAQHIGTFGPFSTYALVTAGGAFAGTVDGTDIGAVISGGGFAVASLGRGWVAGPYARLSKAMISTRQWEFGLILGWGK